jgi:hypothetical protein
MSPNPFVDLGVMTLLFVEVCEYNIFSVFRFDALQFSFIMPHKGSGAQGTPIPYHSTK